jgi:hypothetical protein
MAMVSYAIIETEVGLTVAEVEPGMSAEDVAEGQGGVVLDPGPYKDYDDAYDAMLALSEEEEEEESFPR